MIMWVDVRINTWMDGWISVVPVYVCFDGRMKQHELKLSCFHYLTPTHKQTRAKTYKQLHAKMHSYTYSHAYSHTYTYTYIIHKHVHLRNHIHIHIHMHIPTWMMTVRLMLGPSTPYQLTSDIHTPSGTTK